MTSALCGWNISPYSCGDGHISFWLFTTENKENLSRTHVVSYFYRNTATFDVLMQMGRWFGYRNGYDDLFQIWTSVESASWYEEIANASEELKGDIKTMFDQHLTPKDFGIRVRDFCEDLQITASNKMRSSYDLMVVESYYGNIYDTPYVSRNVEQNRKNWEEVKQLAHNLFNDGFTLIPANENLASVEKSQYFSDVPKSSIIDFVSNIKCSLVNMKFNTDNILDFITDSETEGVDLWDVVFEGGISDSFYDIPGLEGIRCAERSIEEHGNVIQITSRRTILGSREGRFALSKDEIAIAENRRRAKWVEEGETAQGRNIPVKAYFQFLPKRKPVLIIMLLQPKVPKTEENPNSRIAKFRNELGNNKIIAFAIGFPGVKDTEKTKKYKVNKVYYELNMQDGPDEIAEDNEE